MKVLCCIPARYNSKRLLGKPLLKINNNTIIEHVYNQVKKVGLIDDIIILTDSEKIEEEVKKFNGKSEIINDYCLNGTDRIIKFIQKNKIDYYDIILNVQGDEPFINPKHLELVLQNYMTNIRLNKKLVCQTLYYKTNNYDEIKLNSRIKLILDKNNNIIYPSRSIIPGCKELIYNKDIKYNIHIGVFVFNYDYLIKNYKNENTTYQLIEDIEWLKIIEQGFNINATLVEEAERGVDTIEDYEYLVSKYSN